MDFGSLLSGVMGGGAQNNTADLNGVISAIFTGMSTHKDEKGNVDWGQVLKGVLAVAGPMLVAKALTAIKENSEKPNADGTVPQASALASLSESQISNIAGVAGLVLTKLLANNK